MGDFAGAEDWIDVAAGVIGFSKSKIGRKFADACIDDLIKNFRGNVWGNNGPGVITRTLKKICNVEFVSKYIEKKQTIILILNKY